MKKILFLLLISTSAFSQVKISDMASATDLTGTVYYPIIQGGANKKAIPYSFLSPLTISGFNVSMPAATGSVNGYLTSTDWTTFNNKQAAGNYITALTGDVTASGPGSVASTLATVNSNVGTFGSATKSTTQTVNAKGLTTAISEQTITPAIGSITGLGTNVPTWLTTPSSANLRSALTDELGTGAALFDNATPTGLTLTNATGLPLGTGVTGTLPIANGGTNLTTYTTGDLPYASATNTLSKLAIGSTNKVLQVISGVPSWQNTTGLITVQTLTDASTISWDVNSGVNASVTLGATGRTLSITNPVAGQVYIIKIIQDGTGSRTITTWPTGIKWVGGSAPILTTTASAIDIVSFFYDGTNYFGTYTYNFR